jgi:hypothetical protein
MMRKDETSRVWVMGVGCEWRNGDVDKTWSDSTGAIRKRKAGGAGPAAGAKGESPRQDRVEVGQIRKEITRKKSKYPKISQNRKEVEKPRIKAESKVKAYRRVTLTTSGGGRG